MTKRPPRVLLAKPGLDGHDRGVLVIAAALRDAGFEVIYTGLRQTAEAVAAAAEEEDVDVVGLSVLSGAHKTLVPKVLESMRARGLDDVPVVVGGIVPAEDQPALRQAGVAAIFGPGTSTQEVVRAFRELAEQRTESASRKGANDSKRERRQAGPARSKE
jgi:methylmalonyl-CoA mutase C-terminal domain/subunit